MPVPTRCGVKAPGHNLQNARNGVGWHPSAPPAALANEFGAIAAVWQQMEARMYRVSKGRIGPNIAKALEMGQTIQQLGSLLR